MYIVFEGTVGSGKTTQSKRIHAALAARYSSRRQVIWTREPGGTEISDAIRKVVQGTVFNEEMDPITEAYLYAASRAQGLRTVVAPVLRKGGIVVADRSFITSLVFQGIARGLGIDIVWEINRRAVGTVQPDLVVFLDPPVSIAMSRAKDQDGDKFERLGPDFFDEIRSGYLIASRLPRFSGKWVTVDAQGTVEEVETRVFAAIEPYIRKELKDWVM